MHLGATGAWHAPKAQRVIALLFYRVQLQRSHKVWGCVQKQMLEICICDARCRGSTCQVLASEPLRPRLDSRNVEFARFGH